MRGNPHATYRTWTYIGLFVVLFPTYILLRNSTWQGSAPLHTLMEVTATLLALFAGSVGLVHFYSKKNNTYLFLGAGFLGTGLLDGYHAVVTSSFFAGFMPSGLPSLIPWNWIASRVFLSIFLWISYLAWKREVRLGEAGRVRERMVYTIAGLLTLASFLFFAFVPLPRAYYPEIPFHRPEEFVPAFFFLLTLIGYWRKGHWKHDHVEHWLMLSLIIGFMGQAMFMSLSGQLFDMMFDTAHLLKKVSYICVLIGLTISMYYQFRRAQESAQEIMDTNEASQREIAAHQQTIEALKVSEARYEDLYNNAPDMFVSVDTRTAVILQCNQTLVNALGYTREEIIGRPIFDMYHPDCLEQVHKAFQSFVTTGEVHDAEMQLQRKDGSTIDVSLNVSAVRDAQGHVLYSRSSWRDITRRKQAEEMQRRSEYELAIRNRISEIFLTVDDDDMYYEVLNIVLEVITSQYGVFAYIDEQGDVVAPTMTRHIWDKCQVPDKNIVFPRETWGDSTWPQSIREKQTIYSNAPSTNIPEGHVAIRRHVTMPIIHQGEVVGFFQVANKATDYDARDIQLLETIGRIIAPILDARLQRDRYEKARKQTKNELKQILADLRRSNRDLEQFAYVASHDLQEPLRMVSSYTQLLARRYRDRLDDEANEFIEYAVDGAARMQQLINGLLSYSQVNTQGEVSEETDTHAALGQALTNLKSLIDECHALITNDDLPTVRADESQLVQVFQNLVGNGVRFHGMDPPYVHVSAVRRDGEWVFSVRDNGIGIEPAYHERIFEIFQQLHGKDEYPGTGIGLALCKRIVERHHGRIWVESEPGEGATFYFTIPA